MLLLYNIALKLYLILAAIASLVNKKAKKWLLGRKNQFYVPLDKSVWFHFASLGEFEQGRPVLELFRTNNPGVKTVITFFSPSGFEVRKNTQLADAVYYLPLDTARNAHDFISAINPTMAIFTKYEYWYHFFAELKRRRIPLYMISAIFRPEQVFFRWYGVLHRKILTFVNHFFVQDERSRQLLNQLGITEVTVSGDTRFDRVWANAQQPKPLPVIQQFKNKQPLFIAGSSWPDDEKLIAGLTYIYPDWKFIFAPHEISEEKITRLIQLLRQGSVIRYSKISGADDGSAYQTLIIDNMGMLASLYQYGDIAYIGGGFGAGIHNTLEAAAFGIPVIFGPNYARFREARDLISLKAGISIKDMDELKLAAALLTDAQYRKQLNEKIKNYVSKNAGATQMIIAYINRSN